MVEYFGYDGRVGPLGSSHADELALLFNIPLKALVTTPEGTKKDEEMSEKLLDIWTR